MTRAHLLLTIICPFGEHVVVLHQHLALVGYRASGKTSVGRLLAARLACPFVDMDASIEKQVGKSIPQIFEESGEAGFRDLESSCLQAVCAHAQPQILSTGGGLSAGGPCR